MKSSKLLICAVAAMAAYVAAPANGQNIPATLTIINPGLATTGTYDGGTFHTLPAGVLDFTNFDAFCVEPLEGLGYGQTVVYQIQNPASLTNYDSIARLVGGFLSIGPSRTDLDAAALQWAIWEINSETVSGPYSLLGGNVNLAPESSAVAARADQFLANINSYTPATLTYLTNSSYQDVVTWNVVPEPTSLGLATISGMFLLRRRRR